MRGKGRRRYPRVARPRSLTPVALTSRGLPLRPSGRDAVVFVARAGMDAMSSMNRPPDHGDVVRSAATRTPQRVLGNQGASQRWGRRGWMCVSVGLPYRPRVGRGRRSPAVLEAGSPAPLQGCGRRSGAVCFFGGAPHVDGPASSCETLSPPRGRQRAPSGFGRDGSGTTVAMLQEREAQESNGRGSPATVADATDARMEQRLEVERALETGRTPQRQEGNGPR